MKSKVIKLAGVEVTVFEPATPTKNTVLFLHGLGGYGGGLHAYAKSNEVNAWVYCPKSGSGWWDGAFLTNVVVPIIDYMCTTHGVESIDLLTGLSSGGNGVYSYLTQTLKGHNRVKKFAPISINSNPFTSKISLCAEKEVRHFHGALDGIPNEIATTEPFTIAYNKQYPGKITRTVFKNLRHDAWTTVYSSKFTEPTIQGQAPLYVPFIQSLWDWALNNGNEPEEPQEPEPVFDEIVLPILLDEKEQVIVLKTKSGKTLKVKPI